MVEVGVTLFYLSSCQNGCPQHDVKGRYFLLPPSLSLVFSNPHYLPLPPPHFPRTRYLTITRFNLLSHMSNKLNKCVQINQNERDWFNFACGEPERR